MPDEPLQTFESGEQAFLLAKAIVDTVREPLLVLDVDLRIVVASRSFYRTFEMTRPATQAHKIYDLDHGLWDIPELRLLLEKIVPEHEAMGGLRGQARLPEDRASHDAAQCPKGLLRRQWPNDHFARFRGYDRAPKERARPAKAAGAEGDAAHRVEPPRGQLASDYCQHSSYEGSVRRIGRNPAASPGRPPTCHVGRVRAEAPASLSEWGANSGWTVSFQALRNPGELDDRRQPADLNRGCG